jgi:electron transport complex protein RnfE
MSYPSESTPHHSFWQRLLLVCPLLTLADDAAHAAVFAIAACFVVASSNFAIGAIRAFVPEHVRMPAFALVTGLFATTAALLIQAFAFNPTERIALFTSIVVAISIDHAQVLRDPSRAWGRVFVHTFAACMAIGVALVALGAVREAAAGTLPQAVTAPAAFLLAGLSIAANNALRRKA